MWYLIKKCNNKITVKKTGEQNITVSLFSKKSCSEIEEWDLITTITVTSISDINIPNIDNVYKITLYNGIDNIEKVFVNYSNLLKSTIEDIQYVLCGCQCESCEDCTENSEELNNTLLKANFYYLLNSNKYQKYFNAFYKCNECELLNINSCLILNEKIHGKSDNSILLKKILSAFYLSFYFYEKEIFEITECQNSIFNYETIKKCISKLGINIKCIEDNISSSNQPPVIGNNTIILNNRQNKIFNLIDFTSNTTPPYYDEENDVLDSIQIKELNLSPDTYLKLNGINVIINQIITVNQITNGLLTYITKDTDNSITSNFKWIGKDTGSLQYSNNMGTFSITNLAMRNLPPSEVGDYALTVTNRALTTLTTVMFTTGTTPLYADPEGDAAQAIRIDTLPNIGQLQYNGVAITAGQIITMAGIAAGLLKYKSPNQDAQIPTDFTFSVRDTGSMQFTT